MKGSIGNLNLRGAKEVFLSNLIFQVFVQGVVAEAKGDDVFGHIDSFGGPVFQDSGELLDF